MLPYLTNEFGNPSSQDHLYGQKAHSAVQEARESISDLIGSRTEEVIFTSGATESDNLALKGVAKEREDEGSHIITTQVEHKAILRAANDLEEAGFEVTYLPVDKEGKMDTGDLKEALRDDTILVSIMAANNEVGTIYPLEEIGTLLDDHQAYFHVDGAQAVGHIPMDVDAMGIDLLSFSAHKMYGPKGIGGLYLRRRNPKVQLDPLLKGGGQERGYRSGTHNVPAIAGFGEAAELAQDRVGEDSQEVKRLRDALFENLSDMETEVHLNGPSLDGPRLPHNLHVSLPPYENQAILKLIAKKMAISTGSACETESVEESHVLKAMGLPEERIHSSLRFGLGKDTTKQEVDRAVELIDGALNRLSALQL